MFLCNMQMATPSASRWDETPGRPKGSETPGVTPHRPGSETPGATPSTRIWESTPSHVTPGHATPSATPGGNTTPGEGTLLCFAVYRLTLNILKSDSTCIFQLRFVQPESHTPGYKL